LVGRFLLIHETTRRHIQDDSLNTRSAIAERHSAYQMSRRISQMMLSLLHINCINCRPR